MGPHVLEWIGLPGDLYAMEANFHDIGIRNGNHHSPHKYFQQG